MSQEERKLMQLIDEHILNASPEELSKLQEVDISTQLDGIWFYDICNLTDQLPQKLNTRAKKVFSKIDLHSKFK